MTRKQRIEYRSKFRNKIANKPLSRLLAIQKKIIEKRSKLSYIEDMKKQYNLFEHNNEIEEMNEKAGIEWFSISCKISEKKRKL
jgi:hypothetical protein